MNESAFKSPLLVAIGALLGALTHYGYRGKTDAESAAFSATQRLAVIEGAAPAIALQIQSLQRSAQQDRALSDEFKAHREILSGLADCPIPERLHSIAVRRTDAINENARSSPETNVSKSERD